MQAPLFKALLLGMDISGPEAQTEIAKAWICHDLPTMLLAQSNGISLYDEIIAALTPNEMIASTIISATKIGHKQDNILGRLEAKITKQAKHADPHAVPKIIQD